MNPDADEEIFFILSGGVVGATRRMSASSFPGHLNVISSDSSGGRSTTIVPSASADIEEFHDNLMRMEGPPKPKIQELLEAGVPPADVFMMVHISIISRKPLTAVHEEYNRSKGQGWGVIAKEMGIKPGSTVFHNLKEKIKRDVDRISSGKSKNKEENSGNYGKGGGKGKNK